MVKLVDTLDLGSSAARLGGSSPFTRTIFYKMAVKDKKINENHRLISISLNESDYSESYNKSISRYSKNISLNGFRKGFVPKGLVVKMYGKAILSEEINKLFSEKLNNYVVEKKYNLIGEPIASSQIKEQDLDFGNTIDLDFEIGIAPKINVKLIDKKSFNYYKINPAKEDVDKHIVSMRKRYGSMTSPDLVEDEDVLMGDFEEVDSKNNKVLNGVSNSGTISLLSIKDKKLKSIFLGIKKNTKVIIKDIRKTFSNESDLCSLLNIKKEQLDSMSSLFSFELKNIQRVKMASLNEDFFKKVYPDTKIKDSKVFEDKIKEEISLNYQKDTDMLFKYNIYDDFMDNVDIPDVFLKKWLVNRNSLSEKEISKEYKNYSKYFKSQLIEGGIISFAKINVSKEDLEIVAKQNVIDQFKYYGNRNIDESHLKQFTKQILENKEELKRLNEVVLSNKVISFLKTYVKIKEKSISMTEFIKLADKYKK